MDFCVLIEIFVKNCYDVKKLFKNKKKRGFEMLSIIKSAALLGIDSYPVEVEVDLSNGLPAFDIVGLPDSAVKESRERVRTAIRNAGFSFPVKRITVNLAPADTKKEGAAFDLPIALGILSACNLFSAEKTEDALITGELSLDGSVRPVNGVLPMLYDALRRGISVSFVPFENAEEAVFEEKKIEEQEVIVLMDRFGYTRAVDVATYERNKEAADSENKYVIRCLNTGKICIFTDTGKMHQVKVLDIPYGKFRDKGTPIDNICNYASTEENMICICEEEQFTDSKLIFATKQGMIKKVDGSEFQVSKRTIAATKLQEDDEVISVQVIHGSQNVVLQTENGYFLRFLSEEVSEKKKTAIGVRGMKLQKNDVLESVYLFEEGTEIKVPYKEKEVTLNRLKLAKRDGTGTKARG